MKQISYGNPWMMAQTGYTLMSTPNRQHIKYLHLEIFTEYSTA